MCSDWNTHSFSALKTSYKIHLGYMARVVHNMYFVSDLNLIVKRVRESVQVLVTIHTNILIQIQFVHAFKGILFSNVQRQLIVTPSSIVDHLRYKKLLFFKTKWNRRLLHVWLHVRLRSVWFSSTPHCHDNVVCECVYIEIIHSSNVITPFTVYSTQYMEIKCIVYCVSECVCDSATIPFLS